MSRFEALCERVTERFGLVPRADWRREVDRRLLEMSERVGLSRADVLHRALVDDDLALAVVQSLTIGETHFMRCARHFDLIADHIAEHAEPDPERTFRILSAGCATGEEAYSVAIAAAARFGTGILGRLDILGVDLNGESVARAREGVYRPWSFRGAPPWLVTRFTRECETGRAVVAEVRRCTRFRQRPILDFLQSQPADSLDVVLFRNVAIYLTPEATTAVFGEIARVLRPGGVLLVAPGDPRPEQARLSSIPEPSTSAYRRVSEDRSRPRASGVSRPPEKPRTTVTHRPAARAVGFATPEPAPAPPSPSALRALASDGDRATALEAARAWSAREPDAGHSYLLAGQILLEDGRAREARCELRRAVFLASGDPLARFWYASALLADGLEPEARRQVYAARKILVEYRPETLLADGETQAHELAEAACFLEESLA